MSKFIRIICDSAEETLIELKQYENQHPKINAIFIKGDTTNLILNENCTDRISPPKYGISLELI